MTTFLLSYRMPTSYLPGRLDATGTWLSWFDGMGEALVDRGNPTFESTALGNTGADTAVGGYSLISAADLDSAVVLAQGCPAISEGGGVEVGVITRIAAGAD